MQYTSHYDSPLGGITLESDGTSLTGLGFDGQKVFPESLFAKNEAEELPVFGETKRWLDVYFSGRAPDFTPPIAMLCTPFRQTVWRILLEIPYGHTMTYGEIAKRVAEERRIRRMSAQAVGGAVGHNSIAIIIPCHRVVGTNGSLTGYAGGLEKKLYLLRLEKVTMETLFMP